MIHIDEQNKIIKLIGTVNLTNVIALRSLNNFQDYMIISDKPEIKPYQPVTPPYIPLSPQYPNPLFPTNPFWYNYQVTCSIPKDINGMDVTRPHQKVAYYENYRR